MNEFLQSGELQAQAKGLRGYRFVLVFMILMNIVMVLRIPAAPAGQVRVAAAGAITTPATDASPPSRPATSSSEASPATVAPWPSNLARTVTPETASQPADHDHWQSWTRPSVADWLPAIPAWVQEVTRHSDLTDTDQQGANPPVAEPPAASPSPPPTAPDQATVTAEPQTTRRHPSPATSPAAPTGLLLRNPPENNGVIRFLVDRRLLELQPGEAHQFSPAQRWVIQFHPGGDFENVQRSLSCGTYEFRVTSQGWGLTAIGP